MKPWERYAQTGEPAAEPAMKPWERYAQTGEPAASVSADQPETPPAPAAAPEYTSKHALQKAGLAVKGAAQTVGYGYGQLADLFFPELDLGGFAADRLLQTLDDFGNVPADPDLAEAMRVYDEAPFEGKSFPRALADTASAIPADAMGRVLVEQIPSTIVGMLPGGVIGRKAVATAGERVAARVAGDRAAAAAAATVPGIVRGGAAETATQRYATQQAQDIARQQAAAQASQRALQAGTAAGMPAGQIAVSTIAPNIEASLGDGTTLDESIRQGLAATGVEMAVNAPAGALAPFKIGAGPLRNIAAQTGVQSAAGVGGAAAAGEVLGESTSAVELMLEAMFGGVTAPIDIAVVKAPEVKAALRDALKRRVKAESGQDISDADADLMIEERIQAAEEASQAQVLAPENVAPVIDQATGVNTPGPLGTGMPVAEARQARRNVERELGSLFETETNVLRREDVDVTDEGLQLREGARPAQDPAGRQAQPGTLATYRQAADVLAEAGVEVTPENLDIAVSYLDAGQSPVAAANAFRRAARQGDMREGPNVREQDTARVAYGRQDEPTGDYRAGAARGVGDELTPRMAQERAAGGVRGQGRPPEPPAGVGEGMQAPRRAVDRVAETLPGGLAGEFMPGNQPGPAPDAGSPPRSGRTFEQWEQIEGEIRQSQDSERALADQLRLAQQSDPDAVPGLRKQLSDQREQTQRLTQEQAALPAPDQTTAPDTGFDLTQQTEAEAKTLADQLREAEARAAKAEADLAARQQADADRNDFTLTGSNRTADVAAARGQQDLLSQPAAEPTPARTLQQGETLVRGQLETGRVARAGLTPEQMDIVAQEITERSTDAVTGWLDARGGTMKSDVLMDAVATAEETGQEVHFINMDIGNLGGLNAFFNDVSAKANKAYRDITDIIRAELEALGPTTLMRTGGDELGAFVQGVTAADVEAAITRAKAKLQAYTEAEGMSQIEHGKTKEPGYGVQLHVAHTNVGADATGDTVYSATDAQLKQKPETTNETDQTGTQQQPAAPQDGGAAVRAAEPATEDGGNAGRVLPEREAGQGEARPEELQRGRDDEVDPDVGDDIADADYLPAYDEYADMESGVVPEEPVRERTQAQRDFRANKDKIQPEVDSIAIAVGKLGGADPALAGGELDAAGLRHAGVPGKPVVRRAGTGRSLDDLAESLMQYGYRGPGGADLDPNNLAIILNDHAGGKPTYSQAADYDLIAEMDERRARERARGPRRRVNTNLHSGIPLDAIADALKRLFGGEAKLWKNQLARNSQLMNTIKTAMAGRRPGVNPIAQAVRMYWLDADQRLRSIAERANMPGVKRIADAFFLRAGDAAATGRETFHGRLNKRLNSQIDKVEGIRQAFEDAGLKMDDATVLRVRRMLENPNTPRLGKLGEVVRKMETFFKDELAYQREAGLETGEVKGYLPRVIDKGRIGANAKNKAAFVAAAAKAYQIDSPGMSNAQAHELGELRWQREMFGDARGTPGLTLNAGSPGAADFMKGRTLSQKAVEQSGLQDFMVNNPFNLMLSYLQSSAMRAELAKTEVELSDGSTARLGPNWANWAQIKQDLVKEGGDTAYEFMNEIEQMVAVVSGIEARKHYGRMAQVSSWARTISTMGLLELATLTSLPEPLVAGMRMAKGGSTMGVATDLANALQSTVRYGGDAARLLLRLPKRERLQATYDLLHSLGEINANNANAMSVDRFAGGEPASLMQSEMLASYFRGIRLEQFTNYSVTFAAENSMTFMRQLAKDLAAGGKRADNARIHFRDLNIPAAQIDSFAAYVNSLNGANPTAVELADAGRNGALYAGAISKFINESVMRPSSATKPGYAAHPVGAAIFQLQSFPFMYTKQVLSRPFRVAKAQAAEIGTLEAGLVALPFLVGMASIVGLQSLLGGLRDEFAELTSGKETPEQSGLFELERALSWAGAFGKADPILQMISGSRYQKSVAESAAGPTAGRIINAADTLLAFGANNSPGTNTAERKLWTTTMDLVIEPFLQATAGLLPDKGLTGTAMLAARAAGPRTVREQVGEAIEPKEAKPRYSLAERLVGADKAPKRDDSRGSRGERGDRGSR